MADVNRGNRPLSPFMIGTYYRPQMTSISSILVRITGNALIVAVLMIVWWLVAAAVSPECFASADAFLRSWFGDLVFFFSTWALWYHFGGGLRHLAWDFGYCLNVEMSEKLGWAMFIGATVLTFITMIVT